MEVIVLVGIGIFLSWLWNNPRKVKTALTDLAEKIEVKEKIDK